MKVSGIKATGFSRGILSAKSGQEFEMASGTETVSRRGAALEYTVSLRHDIGAIRLTLDESEMRDWHMRLSRALGLASKS